MLHRTLVICLALLLLPAALGGCQTKSTPAPSEAAEAPVTLAAEVKQSNGLWEVTVSVTFAPDTCVWNGDFELCYDTDALELQGEPQELDFFEQSIGELLQTESGGWYTTFVKMYGFEPGTYPVARLTFRQKGESAGSVWFDDEKPKFEDVGKSGQEKVKDYAKMEGGFLAPGIGSSPKVLVGQ